MVFIRKFTSACETVLPILQTASPSCDEDEDDDADDEDDDDGDDNADDCANVAGGCDSS